MVRRGRRAPRTQYDWKSVVSEWATHPLSFPRVDNRITGNNDSNASYLRRTVIFHDYALRSMTVKPEPRLFRG